MLNLIITGDDHRQCRSLHTPNTKQLFVLTILESIKSGAVHTQQPVTLGASQSCLEERVIIALRFQILESLTDGFFCQRRDPQSLDGTLHSRELHHPTLDEFTLLTGITAVHDAVGLLIKILDDLELLLNTGVIDKFNLIMRWNHRQHGHAPLLPLRIILIRRFQFTQVTESPRYLIAITFVIAVFLRSRSQYLGDL